MPSACVEINGEAVGPNYIGFTYRFPLICSLLVITDAKQSRAFHNSTRYAPAIYFDLIDKPLGVYDSKVLSE